MEQVQSDCLSMIRDETEPWLLKSAATRTAPLFANKSICKLTEHVPQVRTLSARTCIHLSIPQDNPKRWYYHWNTDFINEDTEAWRRKETKFD